VLLPCTCLVYCVSWFADFSLVQTQQSFQKKKIKIPLYNFNSSQEVNGNFSNYCLKFPKSNSKTKFSSRILENQLVKCAFIALILPQYSQLQEVMPSLLFIDIHCLLVRYCLCSLSGCEKPSSSDKTLSKLLQLFIKYLKKFFHFLGGTVPNGNYFWFI
jgi:hypothetical protein